MAVTILEALDVALSGSLRPREQLLNVLRKRQLLLILDNFEHLLDGSALLAHMLHGAPRLKLLVTSRERLGLRDEWLFPLGGLRFPDEEEIEGAREAESASVWPGATPEASVATLPRYNALQLFLQCARRVRPDFSLATAGASWVARICQLVQGMPLAIELAAPWVRAMPCREIAQEIERGLGVLITTLRDVPQRHRSMRAVFDHSWGLLPSEERDVLRQLSVFRGGFRREAAEEVAMRLPQSPASLAVLSSLLDRSWLRVTPSGRYEMHELVRQYCGERLDAEPSDDEQGASARVRDDHSRYYAAFLHEREPHLFGQRQREAFEEILEDMGNVWAAWNRAMECGDVVSIGKCVASLEEVAELRGWHDDVNQAFGRAADRLREQLDVTGGAHERAMLAEIRTVLGEILRSQATECFKLGLLQRARQLCDEGLKLLCHTGHDSRQQKARARATGFLGWLLWTRGDHARGYQLLRQALALYEEINDSRGRVTANMIMAAHPHHLGQYSEAEERLQTAVTIAGEAGDSRYHAWCLTSLSTVLCDEGKYGEARRAVEESFRIRGELGDRAGTADSHLGMGKVFAGLKRYESARQHYQQGLAISSDLGDPNHRCQALIGLGEAALAQEQYLEAKQRFGEARVPASKLGRELSIDALIGLGRATCALGEFKRSRQYFCQAVELATEAQLTLETLDALVGFAHLLAGEGALKPAAEFLALAVHHPAIRQTTRDGAQKLLGQLDSELPPEVLAAATARGQERELDDVAAEVLGSNT
jgi:predicted ATPase/Tfp pilus assembly protein PilF